MSRSAWNRLQKEVVNCRACPRLIEHCRNVAQVKRKAYVDESYWGRPVPDFGHPSASLLVVGLAPGAHGANRTGRMFTGDRSGDWLYAALHRAGFANQAKSTNRRDGLELIDAAVTNAGRCAPPGNKPDPKELQNCSHFFRSTLALVAPIVIVPLGGIAWNATFRLLADEGIYQPSKRPKFQHDGEVKIGVSTSEIKFPSDTLTVLGCYHPSQQNTFTGRLTKPMINRVFQKARRRIQKFKGA